MRTIRIFSEQVWFLLQFQILSRTRPILIVDQIRELILIVFVDVSIRLITWVNPLTLIIFIRAILSQLQRFMIIKLLRRFICFLNVHTFMTIITVVFFLWVYFVCVECLYAVEIEHRVALVLAIGRNRFGVNICLLNVWVASKELCLTLDVMLMFF